MPPDGLPLRYPSAREGRLVVTGYLASRPFGGMTWQVLHYLAGFRRLGFDVWYVEEFDGLELDPETADYAYDPSKNLRFVERQLRWIGMEDRWIYRRPHTDEYFGAGESKLLELYRTADAVVDVCGAQPIALTRPEIKRLVYIETDPVTHQLWIDQGDTWHLEYIGSYDVHFTYGERLGAPDCPVPTGPFEWHPTRAPIVIDWWAGGTIAGSALTTVTSWEQTGKEAVLDGRLLSWSKRDQWLRFAGLPSGSELPLELCVQYLEGVDREMMLAQGWRLASAHEIRDPDLYRSYIVESLGEFTIAKEQVVVPRPGWFSDRSACYLAAGRPVIAQDTGFDEVLPTGEGLFSFTTEEEALIAIAEVAGDQERHAKAASEIAHEYFDSSKVLEPVVDTMLHGR